MKTPEEIKKNLFEKFCSPLCKNCPYCFDAATLIEQLEHERDALLADLTTACADVPNPCLVCGHYRMDWEKPGCELSGYTCAWTWRGIKKEN